MLRLYYLIAYKLYVLTPLFQVLGHGALASSLWLRAHSVDLNSNESTHSLYMFLWKASEMHLLIAQLNIEFLNVKGSYSIGLGFGHVVMGFECVQVLIS